MIYFNVLGQHFLFLCSSRRTTDLLEKRSSNYSDRPRMPMLLELYVSDLFHLNDLFSNILFIHIYLFVAEWSGISTLALFLMARGGENCGNYSMRIFTLTRCTNTNLCRDERSMLFCVDYLSHPTTSSTTFDSKSSSFLCDFVRALINNLGGGKPICRYYHENFIWDWR